MPISGSQNLLRTINRLAVLRTVRITPGVSRIRLAERLALTRPTISSLVDELILDGWLSEIQAPRTGSVGRRPIALYVDDSSRALLGAAISGSHVICTATTLGGEVRELSVTPLPEPDVELALDILATQVRNQCEVLRLAGFQPSALGIAVPGPVDAAETTLLQSDSTPWRNVPVAPRLRQRLLALGLPEFPLFAQRAASCLALYHFDFKRQIEEEPLLYAHAGQGLAATISGRYTLLRGARGQAGAIAHMPLDASGPLCRCGQHGCAQMLASLEAVERQLGCAPETLLNTERAPEARAALRAAGRHFGTVLHNLRMQVDPQRIYAGGPAFQSGPDFFAGVEEQYRALQLPDEGAVPAIEVVRHSREAVALGAATGALYALVRPLA